MSDDPTTRPTNRAERGAVRGVYIPGGVLLLVLAIILLALLL